MHCDQTDLPHSCTDWANVEAGCQVFTLLDESIHVIHGVRYASGGLAAISTDHHLTLKGYQSNSLINLFIQLIEIELSASIRKKQRSLKFNHKCQSLTSTIR